VRDGALVWSGSCGGAVGDAAGLPDSTDGTNSSTSSTDIQYRIGSLTKTLTAVAVLQCRDDGLVDLDEPVGTYLPGAPWPGTSVRRLLSHAGGLPAEPEGPWWERHDGGDLDQLLAQLSQRALVVTPGAQHHYSNVGYALLGAAVERVRQRPWGDVVAERVLGPLGMHRTTYAPAPPHAQGWSVHPWSGRLHPEPHTDTGAMAPAGQLWSTVGDLARWAAFWLEPDPGVLAPDTVDEMLVPTAARPGDQGGAYGLGLRLELSAGRTLSGHGGSMPGFLAGILVDPDALSAAVTLANATTGGTPQLTLTLLETLRSLEPPVPVPWSQSSIEGRHH